MSNEEITNQDATSPSRKRALLIGAWLIIAVTGALGYWFLRGTRSGNLAGRPVPTPDFDVAPPSAGGAAPRPGDLLITIQPDKRENAHFKIEAAVTQPAASGPASGLRTTGTVEPNAYMTVPVLPIAGGIVKQINFELGDKVERGQKLATIFSTELADAQTAYLSMLAENDRREAGDLRRDRQGGRLCATGGERRARVKWNCADLRQP